MLGERDGPETSVRHTTSSARPGKVARDRAPVFCMFRSCKWAVVFRRGLEHRHGDTAAVFMRAPQRLRVGIAINLYKL